MRKLFRFKYEPCNKTCYAWCQKLTTELRKLEPVYRENLVNNMVVAHNKLCDNPNYSFGLDVDENNDVFVSHFRTPNKTDLYSNKSFAAAIETVCEEVMKTDIPQIIGNCVFGDNGAEDLGKTILKYCTDAEYAKIKDTHCECKAH